MLKNRTGLIPIVAGILIVLHASAATDPQIGISVWAASQPTAPLQVVGFEKSSVFARGVEVRLRNVSEKAINSFRVQGAFRAACPSSGNAETWGNGSALQKEVVLPGAFVQAEEQVAGTSVIAMARELKASFVHVQVGVLEVDFADGTVWKNRFPAGSQLFNPELVESDAQRCLQWPTPSAIEQLKRDVMIAKDPSSGVLELRSNGYFMSCSIRDGKAFCPTF